MANIAIKYETDHGEIELSFETVRQYLVSGDGNVSDQEVVMFMNLCKYQKLNPFIKEAYLIKYSDKAPATIVTGKDVFTKRASKIKECKGWQAGVVTMNNGDYTEREGTVIVPGEKLIGGWCTVERDGWNKPFKVTASLNEYNTGKSSWVKMPATMIRKVAIVQALRDCFPESFQGLYSQEEMSITPELPFPTLPVDDKITPKMQKELFDIVGDRIEVAKECLKEHGYLNSKEVKAEDFEMILADLATRMMEFGNEQTEHDNQESVVDAPTEDDDPAFENIVFAD